MCLAFRVVLLVACSSLLAWSHRGLPAPLIQNRLTPFGELSISADLELGEGNFLIILNPDPKLDWDRIRVELNAFSSPAKEETLNVVAQRDPNLEQQGTRLGFRSAIPFPHAGPWTVDVTIDDSQKKETLVLNAEVLLPGPNKAEFIIYALPFALVTLLAITMLLKKRRHQKPFTL